MEPALSVTPATAFPNIFHPAWCLHTTNIRHIAAYTIHFHMPKFLHCAHNIFLNNFNRTFNASYKAFMIVCLFVANMAQVVTAQKQTKNTIQKTFSGLFCDLHEKFS